MLAPKAAAKKLEFVCDVQADLPRTVHGDLHRLRQILINLINNAIKFTDRGEVVVQVARSETLEPGLLRFSVCDTGPGIPAEGLDRLFKSFSQVDASTTRKYGGTGLGLAIARQLAELMGGQIGVESSVGQGSRFWFTARLPAATVVPGRRRTSLCGAALHGMRVLAVDDHAGVRETLRDNLMGWGISVDVAASGEEALRHLRMAAAAGRPYRVALVDLIMPEMGGEAARSSHPSRCPAVEDHFADDDFDGQWIRPGGGAPTRFFGLPVQTCSPVAVV